MTLIQSRRQRTGIDDPLGPPLEPGRSSPRPAQHPLHPHPAARRAHAV